jgi:threonine dehydratase
LKAVSQLDVVYAPIGLGSGICGLFAARDALKRSTEIVAVVAANAPAYARSLERGVITPAPAQTLADGMACRVPNADAFATLQRYRPRVVCVTERQIAQAMLAYFRDTHNVAEGAGAATLAAALADPQGERYCSAGVVLSGGNVDAADFAAILNDATDLRSAPAAGNTPYR